MIGKILQPAATSGRVLDYNEMKVAEGEASVVDIRNIASNDIATFYDTFEEYESNPSIAEQVRKKSLHWTLGPGPTDKLSEEDCIALIEEVMERLGYSEQPYVVYRHNDIEREHFHIVSTRVKKNGKAIDTHYEGRRLLSILKELAPKYGYTVGIDKKQLKEGTLPVVPSKEYSSKDPNILVSLAGLFEDALKYDFHSVYQFQAVMLAMNVRMTLRRRKDGGQNVILQGLDDNGKRATRLYSMESMMGIEGGSLYAARLAENNEIGIIQADRKVAVMAISDYCYDHTHSLDEYCAALEETGIRHVVTRDKATDAIKRVTLVEKNTYALVDSAVRGELFVKAFVDAEKNGHWAPPAPKRKRPVPGAKVRKEGDKPFFTPERTAEVKAIIARAVEQHRGRPISQKPAIGQGGPKLTNRK